MKAQSTFITVTALMFLAVHSPLSPARAATTINPANHYAYGANLGWLDWRSDTNNGAVIGEYVCSGQIYSANVGWINLGNGSPANHIQYQNNSAGDFGVNQDGLGNLRGYAYGANIGWINFENTGAPKVDLKSGVLSGYIYSANCGWISLSNAQARVQTDSLQPGVDSDGDGITDAWELSHTNSLSVFTASTDTDGDGVSDLAEHGADTNPLDPNDLLRITDYTVMFSSGVDADMVTWSSKATRCYQVQYRTNYSTLSTWLDATSVIAPDPGEETTSIVPFGSPSTERYFQVQAIKPLTP